MLVQSGKLSRLRREDKKGTVLNRNILLTEQEGVSNIAINDAFMLEAAIYFLLKKHFRKLPCYVGLLELFHDVRAGMATVHE